MVNNTEFNLILKQYLFKYWFPSGILLCILVASIHPEFGSKNGPLKPETTVKYGAVSIIFLISGISLKTESFLYTLKQFRLHAFIQCFTFILFPFFVQILVKILGLLGVLDGWILKGLVTAACMPPPVSSAVILTRAANGNEAAAIFNSIVGSFLGIILTPILLLLNLGWTTLVPLAGTILQLSITVLIPLLVGQLIRRCISHHRLMPLNILGQCALLLIIYTTFCDTFEARDYGLNALDVLLTIFLVLLIQMLLVALSFIVAVHMDEYSPQDVVTIVFCCTHKSLTLGIPILRIMFHGFSHFAHISLPLLIYHPTQIILGGLLVTVLKDWIHKNNKKRLPI